MYFATVIFLSMKHIPLLFFLMSSYFISAQTLNAKVLDSITKYPIAYANVTFLEKNLGTYTDEDGSFSLETRNSKDIIITALGYKDYLVNIDSLSIDNEIVILKLKPSSEGLQEIFITHKKKEYTKPKKIGDSKKGKIKTSLPFGYEFANYIENPYYKEGLIENVILSLNKDNKYDYMATYNIKFYEYDNLNKKPGRILHHENLIVQPENKTYLLNVDVSKLYISYPINGICIGVEVINKDQENPLKKNAIIAPKINFTHTNKKVTTWSRYRNKEWNVRTRKSPFKSGDNGFVNALINLNVKIVK